MTYNAMLVSGAQQSDSVLHIRVCVCSVALVRLIAILQTVARQAPLSMEFSRQEYWSELPCPSPGDLPNPGIEPPSLRSPALADGFFSTDTTWGKGGGFQKLGHDPPL